MKTFIRVAIVIAVLGVIAPQPPTASAQKESVPPSCVLTVPASWGEFKGASHEFGLAFQGRDGTLRFIRDLACEVPGFQRLPPMYLEVRRK